MKALWTVGIAAAIVSQVGTGAHSRQLEPALRQPPSGSAILLAESEREHDDKDKEKTPKPTKTPEPTKTPKPKKTPSPHPSPTNVSPHR